MPLDVEILGEEVDAALAARENVGAATRLLDDVAPIHARWVLRYLRVVVIANLRAQRFVATSHGLILGAEFTASAAAPAIALRLVLTALRVRLAPFLRRQKSGDRRAQHWWRVRAELRLVARRLDHAEDPSGYIPGVSTGRWETWIEAWLSGAGLARVNSRRIVRRLARDLRRTGVPRFLLRILLAFLKWRWRTA